MQCAALCYASADTAPASQLRSFIEANCRVALEDGVIPPESNLLDTVEMGLALDFVLVLLSPDSAGNSWARERWQSVFIEQPRQFATRVAFLLLRDCNFPRVLRREIFFDLSRDRLAGQRALKLWLLEETSRSQAELRPPVGPPSIRVTPAAL